MQAPAFRDVSLMSRKFTNMNPRHLDARGWITGVACNLPLQGCGKAICGREEKTLAASRGETRGVLCFC